MVRLGPSTAQEIFLVLVLTLARQRCKVEVKSILLKRGNWFGFEEAHFILYIPYTE